MQLFSYTLFNKVFIDDDNFDGVPELELDFEYKGKNYEEIKESYLSYNLKELRDILYLYDISMEYTDFGNNGKTYFKHQERVKRVIEYIECILNKDIEIGAVEFITTKGKSNDAHKNKLESIIKNMEEKLNNNSENIVTYDDDYQNTTEELMGGFFGKMKEELASEYGNENTDNIFNNAYNIITNIIKNDETIENNKSANKGLNILSKTFSNLANKKSNKEEINDETNKILDEIYEEIEPLGPPKLPGPEILISKPGFLSTGLKYYQPIFSKPPCNLPIKKVLNPPKPGSILSDTYFGNEEEEIINPEIASKEFIENQKKLFESFAINKISNENGQVEELNSTSSDKTESDVLGIEI